MLYLDKKASSKNLLVMSTKVSSGNTRVTLTLGVKSKDRIKLNTKDKARSNFGELRGGISTPLGHRIGPTSFLIHHIEQYSGSGWGRSSSGDYHLYHGLNEAKSFLTTLGYTVFTIEGQKDIKTEKQALAFMAKREKLKKDTEALGLSVYNDTRCEISRSSTFGKSDPAALTKSSQSKQLKRIESRSEELLTFEDTFGDLIKAFASGSLKGKKTIGEKYIIDKDAILVKENRYYGANEPIKHNILAVKMSGKALVNSRDFRSESYWAERYCKKVTKGMTLGQVILRKYIKAMLPFNVFEAAGLDLAKTKIVEQGPEEKIQLGETKRHFTGALLLENDGKQYLFDLDREEIKHGIWNAFLTNIPEKCATIAEAYDCLKPLEVKQAESEGKEVVRQGEFFFIKTDQTWVVPMKDLITENWNGTNFRPANWSDSAKYITQLRHGNSRPNSCLASPEMRAESLVAGIVKHSGREHRNVDLGYEKIELTEQGKQVVYNETPRVIPRPNHWRFNVWRAVPNTAIGNFTIQGDVD